MIEITKDTKVSAILQEYGDIADVMEVFGVKRVGRYSLRRMITKALTVERAARVHRVPVDEFVDTINKAVSLQESNRTSVSEEVS
jgi:virulence-associated protein VapD